MSERFRSTFAEGILIVASILVAFAIDAWWEERQNRAEERRILESFRAEVIGYLSPVGGFAAEAALELERLMQEAENMVVALDQELAKR